MYNRNMKGKILMKGLVRVVCGVAISAAYGAAVYGFFMTHRESGYLAVLDFMASMAALTVAVAGSYKLAVSKKRCRLGWTRPEDGKQ